MQKPTLFSLQHETINIKAQEKMKASGKIRALNLAVLQGNRRLTPENLHKFLRSSGDDFQASGAALKDMEAFLDSQGIRVLYQGHSEWPRFAAGLTGGEPRLLYARGAPMPSGEGLAVVGSRTSAPYAIGTTTQIVRRWAALHPGGYIVTGGGMGVDAAAMRAALEVGLATIVVVASGVARPTPRVHAALFEEVSRMGTLISENFPGLPCYPSMFPYRNRLIPALSCQAVVVRAELPSGSFHTLRHASKMQKPLWVVVGPLGDPGYAGNIAGIRRGWAKPLLSLDDLGSPGVRKDSPKILRSDVSPEQRMILGVLEGGFRSPADVAETLGLTASTVMRIMLSLEMAGLVARDFTNQYRLVTH